MFFNVKKKISFRNPLKMRYFFPTAIMYPLYDPTFCFSVQRRQALLQPLPAAERMLSSEPKTGDTGKKVKLIWQFMQLPWLFSHLIGKTAIK